MKLEIENRKLTTSGGLLELAKLITDLSEKMCGDIWNFGGTRTFKVKVFANNGYPTNDIYYHSWYLHTGKWVFKDGYIVLQAESSDTYDGEPLEDPEDIDPDDFLRRIAKIDFSAAMSCLEELVMTYNDKVKAKDDELCRFLSICESFTRSYHDLSSLEELVTTYELVSTYNECESFTRSYHDSP